jgi:hypothetical protein
MSFFNFNHSPPFCPDYVLAAMQYDNVSIEQKYGDIKWRFTGKRTEVLDKYNNEN